LLPVFENALSKISESDEVSLHLKFHDESSNGRMFSSSSKKF
jgi:hypothetical protein